MASSWSDPATIAALAAAAVTIYNTITSRNGRKEVRESAAAAAVSAAAAVEGTRGVDNKLTDIKATAEKTAAQTDGQLSRLHTVIERTQAEKDVLQRMLSETTTLLAASQAAKGHNSSTGVAIGGRRADDKPVAVEIVNAQHPPEE